jgi:hypothetical protein
MSQLSLEAALLHLVIEGDLDTARHRILTEMLPGEQRQLADHADQLAELCRQPGLIRSALTNGCQWLFCCPNPDISGYYYGRRDAKRQHPIAICATHRLAAIERGCHVFDPPTEVKL